MIIVDKNLEQLCGQMNICERLLVDEFSLHLRMGDWYYLPIDAAGPVVFNHTPNPEKLFSECLDVVQNLTLFPGARVISCTKDRYKIPLDYFGLVQTKGTLARLFVSITCNDGQVEPGFEGFITLEIINNSPWVIEIPVGSFIGQMYLIKCSSSATSPYKGRYAEHAKSGPTLPIFRA